MRWSVGVSIALASLCACKGDESRLAAWNPPMVPDAAPDGTLAADESTTAGAAVDAGVAIPKIVDPPDETDAVVWKTDAIAATKTRVPKVDRDDVTAVPPTTGPVPLVVFVDAPPAPPAPPSAPTEPDPWEKDSEPPTDRRAMKVQIAAGPATWAELATFAPTERAEVGLALLNRKVREQLIYRRPMRDIVQQLRAPGQAKAPAAASDARAAPTSQAIRGRGGMRYLPEHNSERIYPERASEVVGEVATDRVLIEPQSPLVVATPTTPARVLVDVLAATEGSLLVNVGDRVLPLRLQFARHPAGVLDGSLPEAWIEVRVTRSQVVVETVADVPIAVPWPMPNADALATAYRTNAAKPGYQNQVSVDVLVPADVDVQQLVDVLVALDRAGAQTIGLGWTPPPNHPDSILRGEKLAPVVFGQPSLSGDLDKAVVRKTLRDQHKRFGACYAAALANYDGTSGTVQANFMIDGNGKVVTANASFNQDATLASCFSNVIRTTTFPKPKNGGNVQVFYPFTLRPRA